MTPFGQPGDWWALLGHFVLMSLVSVGGPIATTSEMHRFLVERHHWLTSDQFTAAIAIAQAAPGPNLLFVAVFGWTIAGCLGMCVTMAGILVPSTLVTLTAARWGEARRDTRGVRAFVGGMAPLTVGLVLSTGWLLGLTSRGNSVLTALIVLTVVVSVRYRLSPLWLIAAGGAVGALMGGLGRF